VVTTEKGDNAGIARAPDEKGTHATNRRSPKSTASGRARSTTASAGAASTHTNCPLDRSDNQNLPSTGAWRCSLGQLKSPPSRYIRMMSRKSQEDGNSNLDPVLEAAMNDLTSWVYDSHVTGFLRPHQLTTHFHLDGPRGSGRAACVAMFKHLKHFGVEWDTSTLCDWATRRGWVTKDIALFREFGDGVQSGTRFHTDPQPWAQPMMESWLRGVPMIATARPNRPLKIMSCCRKHAALPPSRAEKMARSSGRFLRN
jgi:hypothetical protein